MLMKNSNDTIGIEPTTFRLVVSTNCVSACPQMLLGTWIICSTLYSVPQ